MRVIAGELRGSRISSPGNRDIRPTSDRAKGAIFSMAAGQVEGARALDLFSGTGSLGIEAISRGAAHCTFCDNSRESVRLLRENLARLGVADRATVVFGDFRRALKCDRMDLIFMDPPYGSGLCGIAATAISQSGVLADGGLLVCESGAADAGLPDLPGLALARSKIYGRTRVDIYIKE